MIENFWIPFFSGIFLETELKTEAAFLRFLFKMFSLSPVAVPAKGISQLPEVLFSQLRNTQLSLNTRVSQVTPNQVHLSSGESLSGAVIDTRPPQAKSWGSVTTLYFAAPESPICGPWLMLNSKKNQSLINHLAVMSEVSKDYARKSDALISVNILRSCLTPTDLKTVVEELSSLFGEPTKSWRFLKSFEIDQALPLYLSVPAGSEAFNTPSQQGAFRRAQQLISLRQKS
jgi:hypothetical protein